MKINLLFVISLLLSVLVSAETVYKTRDANGNIIFTDVPSEGAQVIEIREIQTTNTPDERVTNNRRTEKLSPEETTYSRFEIINPENDVTIRSNEGAIAIELAMEPVLDDNHKIVFSMDGKEISSGKFLKLALSDVDRGTHNIIASVKNEKNEIIKQSNNLVFHLRKDSVLFKNRNNNDAVPANNNPQINPNPQNPPL